MHMHKGVVVDVHDPRVRRHLVGDLVDVALGGQARPDVQELADAGLGGQIADGALQEGAVLPGTLAGLRRCGENRVGGGAVNGIVVLTAKQRIVDPRRVRDSGVDAGGRTGPLLAGHTGSWWVAVARRGQSGT
jgi:hypothetical protein